MPFFLVGTWRACEKFRGRHIICCSQQRIKLSVTELVLFSGSSSYEVGAAGTIYLVEGPTEIKPEIEKKMLIGNNGQSYPRNANSRGKIDLAHGRWDNYVDLENNLDLFNYDKGHICSAKTKRFWYLSDESP